jgi:hypothetical protein
MLWQEQKQATFSFDSFLPNQTIGKAHRESGEHAVGSYEYRAS